jgi:hypothetical protein
MKEEMDLDIQFLEALFSNNTLVSDGAMRELNTRMIQFNRRTDITRNNMVNSLFANGKVWIGTDGQVLASSSGAQITFDPGVPTGQPHHQGRRRQHVQHRRLVVGHDRHRRAAARACRKR